MQIITVELLNDNALRLLQLLEQLKIIKLSAPKIEPPIHPRKKWAGAISKGTAAKMLHHVEQTRREWERI